MTNSNDNNFSSVLVLGPTTPARQRLGRFLERQNMEVVATDLLADALRLMKTQRFHLLVLQVGLGFSEGLPILQKLRQEYDPDQLAILAIGDSRSTSLAVRSFALGADDFMTEPVDLQVFLARIELRIQVRAAQPKEKGSGDPKPSFENGFRLDSRIGEGQFGAVFRATRQRDGQRVAVKLLRRNLLPKPESRERFRREIETVSQIQHPNTVKLIESGESTTGNPFLIMELLQGHTLEEEMAQHGKIPLHRCCKLVEPICEVLTIAHHKGIVHRDIKPQNIFLHRETDGSKTVKVLDFGIAKLIDNPEDQHLTREGIGPGTPSYMAPERFYEEPYDGAADVYSVGVMLHEMLVGELPFVSHDANPVQVAVKHMTEPPPPLRSFLPDLPQGLESLVLEALEKQPSLRPDAAEMGRRLASFRVLGTSGTALGHTA